VWLEVTNICNKCKLPVDGNDIKDLSLLKDSIYEVLHIKCKYAEKGCKHICSFIEIDSHETDCVYGRYPAVILREPSTQKRGPSMHKIPLAEADKQYVKKKRLKPIITSIDNFCDTFFESKLDVLFFLLNSELRKIGQSKKTDVVYSLWQKENVSGTLSPKECLALRVDTLQSKTV
jgi:hypothetical protein